MRHIGKEARDFVRACETVQALLLYGKILESYERDLIEHSAADLLTRLKRHAGDNNSQLALGI